jgi:DNA replication and repair protein RecF
LTVYSIETENFRALETQRIEFSPGVNVITGSNAQGKTTVLEAVYLLTGSHSFRTRFDRELTTLTEIRPL